MRILVTKFNRPIRILYLNQEVNKSLSLLFPVEKETNNKNLCLLHKRSSLMSLSTAKQVNNQFSMSIGRRQSTETSLTIAAILMLQREQVARLATCQVMP